MSREPRYIVKAKARNLRHPPARFPGEPRPRRRWQTKDYSPHLAGAVRILRRLERLDAEVEGSRRFDFAVFHQGKRVTAFTLEAGEARPIVAPHRPVTYSYPGG